MAQARFRFHDELADFLPEDRRGTSFDHVFHHRGSVKDMIEALGVPHPEVDVILVGGSPVGFGHIVSDGETLEVFPVGAAPVGVGPEHHLQPPLPEAPAFVLDVHLGTLARYLRLAGFDSLYRNDYDDEELAQISAYEDRILLTRDRDALKRAIVRRGYLVRRDRPRRQLAEVFARFSLAARVEPFKRCSHCNGLLEAVDKAHILHRLEPKTRRYYDEFRRCRGCDQVYWKGSHFRHLERLLASVAPRA